MKSRCRSLYQDLASIGERLREAVKIALFLDFDGTLVPLVRNPSDARLDEGTRQMLTRVSRHSRIVTTIISGRPVSDLCGRIGLSDVIYAGNHGLEILGRHLRFLEPVAAARREELAHLARHLAAKLREVDGAVVEYKGLTTSVHYRGVAISEIDRVESTVQAEVAPATARFRMKASKLAFEIVPRTNWNKGKAALWIGQHLGVDAVSIYLGDDVTDEDAFRVLPDGITVHVGESDATLARYCLADPSAVHEFLAWLDQHVPA
jgi:trehalose-phosphatase